MTVESIKSIINDFCLEIGDETSNTIAEAVSNPEEVFKAFRS